VKDAHTTLNTKLTSDEELLQTLLTGLSSNNAKTKGGGYMGQLAEAKARIAQGAGEEEQAKVKLSMQQKELGALEARLKAHAKEAGDNAKKVESLMKGLNDSEKKVEACGWGVGKEKELESAIREGKEEVKALTEVCSS
jgi:structural maintenance of chromosome 2